jgi:hypothetical protein
LFVKDSEISKLILNTNAINANISKRLLPPKLIKGRVIPLVGSIPLETPIFINT